MAKAIVWFRRDLRLSDLPALLSAADHAEKSLAVFVLDDALLKPAGRPRMDFLVGCLRALDGALGGRLLLLAGNPLEVIPELVLAIDAESVHVSADFGPYGGARDRGVEAALASLPQPVPLVRTGSPYAVSPGRVFTKSGGPYRVFTPYRRAWIDHGWRAPADTGPGTVDWLDPSSVTTTPDAADLWSITATSTIPAGEDAALARWREFHLGPANALDTYAVSRDRPDLNATSRLSPYLKFGCIHPRTLLHEVGKRTDPGAVALRGELAWRDFYADVLHHRPETARANFNAKFDTIAYDAGPAADAAFDAWRNGETGYPIVDAGMRQLLAEHWMHNRVRMIVASFLTKDLHLPWWRGARHFMTTLVDGDLASNQHGWQWTAGCGTDAAPYFRVFNPITQGERFDPTGDYVRRWIPELRGVAGKAVHRPWQQPDAELFASDGRGHYPQRIVDHDTERQVALARYADL